VRETHLGGLRAVRDDRSRARDDGRLAPNFGVIDDELQRSVDNEIRLRGGDVTRRRATWRWFDAAMPPMERQRARVAVRVSLFVDEDLS
jgi:hypothetical protein